MPDHRPHAAVVAPHRIAGPTPAKRTIVLAVVTELAPALEPVGRDPFIDGDDDARLRRAEPARWSLSRPVARAL